MISYYAERKIKARDFRDLSEIDRKLFVQRLINQVLYDPSRFEMAMKLIENWEKNSNIVKEN
jgi:hypothetical protein